MGDDVPTPMRVNLDKIRRAASARPTPPEPEGVCVFCKTLTVKAVIVRKLIPGATPIIGPGSLHQYHTVTVGYHCTTCGLRYEFPTKPSQP